MKVITEAILRDELKASRPESYTIPAGKLLSPAAREYLQQCKIKIVGESVSPVRKSRIQEDQEEKPAVAQVTEVTGTPAAAVTDGECKKPRFVDYETGAYYYEKPEHMTHLYGNVLVPKDHKRIQFRGKLDSLQAIFILNQTILNEMGSQDNLIMDLGNILDSLREMMRCDVLNESLRRETIIGLTHAELRERSHDPMKYYQVKQMVLPDYSLGKAYALLNQLRTQVRETEVAAAAAFHNGRNYERGDIIEELNRMSSAMHIIMCKYLAGAYGG